MEATGMANKMLPSSASFRSKAAAMVGMREVQLEKLKPARKKKVLRAMRWLRKEGMETKFRGQRYGNSNQKKEALLKLKNKSKATQFFSRKA